VALPVATLQQHPDARRRVWEERGREGANERVAYVCAEGLVDATAPNSPSESSAASAAFAGVPLADDTDPALPYPPAAELPKPGMAVWLPPPPVVDAAYGGGAGGRAAAVGAVAEGVLRGAVFMDAMDGGLCTPRSDTSPLSDEFSMLFSCAYLARAGASIA